MHYRHTRIDRDSIAALMATFYDLMRQDALMAPIVHAAIGESSEQWTAHLANATEFWLLTMADGKRAMGRPMRVHSYLHGRPPAFFRRWLEIFAEATADQFPNHLAQEFMQKAREMANTTQASMAIARGRPE